MKVCKSLLLITFLMTLVAIPFVQASPSLNVTVTTDKPYYISGESVNVNGTLTQNGVSVEDGLVAIQVIDPDNATVAVRTQETGTNPIVGLIEIVEAFPCDPFTGAPKSSFDTGELFGLKVTVNNTDSIPHYVLVVVNAYDASGVTLGTSAGMGQATPGERFFILATSISISAYTGNATAYAGVYTDWPKNVGVPYCPETSVSYEILETGGSSVPGSAGPEAQNPAPGTYNITFKLSTNHKAGTYTAYATSSYAGENATASTTFNFEAAFPIVFAGQTFYITLETNSTLCNLSNFKFNETFAQGDWRGEFNFSATGPYHPSMPPTIGQCNLTIPNDLWTGDPWEVLIDGVETSFDTYPKNETHTLLTFSYTHAANPRKIQIYGTWVNPGILVHDVAVVGITAPMYATLGDTLSIGVKVKNEGSHTEEANVTLYYETTYIGSQNVTLNEGTSVTVPFTWNTSGLTPGSYTLNATATIDMDDEPTDNAKTATITLEEAVHDVAVTSVVPSTFEVLVGDSVKINATIKNEGNVEESFTLNVYAGVNLVGTETATLAAGATGTYTFTWTTTAVGNFTIRAEVPAVPDEVDTTDNTWTTTLWRIAVIPEFPTLIPLLLTLVILAVSTIILKRITKKPLTRRPRQ